MQVTCGRGEFCDHCSHFAHCRRQHHISVLNAADQIVRNGSLPNTQPALVQLLPELPHAPSGRHGDRGDNGKNKADLRNQTQAGST